jgi:hypothetical protein
MLLIIGTGHPGLAHVMVEGADRPVFDIVSEYV